MTPDPSPPITPPNGGSRPVPDPTVLTTSLVDRAEKSLKEWVMAQFAVRDQRIDGNDEATKLHRVTEAHPGVESMVEKHIANLQALMTEKFDSVGVQFRDRDVLASSDKALNALALAAAFAAAKEAVAAALTAQKEASAKQDEANQKAIEKSERATAETIKTNQELSSTRLEAQQKSIDELKLLVNGLLARGVGAKEDRTGLYATLAATFGVVLFVLTVAGFILTQARA